ncbi:MAG TPA: hypothetical protein VGX68_24045 [Thermoanaerobaculia bacterium]|jgi:hypothetical protein|nr:hypothetical protein [Thermoanaerobaculia bacterium]
MLTRNDLLAILPTLFLLSACATAPSKWQTLALGSAVLDLGSTGAALQKDGLREGNPLYGERPSIERILVVNLAAYGGVWALTRDLKAEQQRRIWRNVAILRLLVTGWNLRQSGCACFRLSL